ncbi:MAG TPA: DegT/DnrJ/EryC1/StrS aminotransferase family protein [Patescibacteria group bacterium]|nr:DegT/DnrJ/EryC1/StrS aminotransferase family protein [Patescibacteria group bacterium]
MIRPIHPGLSPNVEREDFVVALSRIIKPNSYNKGNETERLEDWFKKFYKEKAYAFSSARGALYVALVSLGVVPGDEVLVTGFTCIAVIDAILATGARPVYIDIQKNFQLDFFDIKNKTTKKTKVLILQHTFGIPSGTKEILHFAKSNNIFVVEDVAHGVGITDKGKLLGTYGIASVFSLGRDKAFSCVSGGIVITKDSLLADRIQELQNKQNFPSKLLVFQNLFHIVAFYLLILPLYDALKLGKILLVMFQKLHLLAKPIDMDELEHFESYYKKLSPALSAIALSQLKRLHKFNAKRVAYTTFYQKNIKTEFVDSLPKNVPLLRFPLLVDDPEKLKKIARKKHVYLGDWYSNGVDPKNVDLSEIFYEYGMCPTDEYISQHIINLPTYPTMSKKDVQKVVTIVQDYVKNQRNKK